eukprot:Gb_29232 [translate_table: standard]
MQAGITHAGSIQEGLTQYVGILHDGPRSTNAGFTRVGLTTHRRDKSKSESMIWPFSLIRTFSGFKSL